MSSLSVYLSSNPELPLKILNHDEDITSTLAGSGLVYRAIDVPVNLRPGVEVAEFDSSCALWLAELAKAGAYGQQHVLNVDRRHQAVADVREPYLAEQQLAGRSAWLMVGGFALLSVHLQSTVYQLRLEKGAMLELPTGTPYWLDIGQDPHVLAVQFCESTQPAKLTGEAIAQAFAGLDD